MKELTDIKEIFLSSDVDEETRADNLDKIKEWEQSLIQNENFLSWQEHDITKEIFKQVRTSYKDFAMRLATDRTLTESQRMSLWSKQDACVFLLSLVDKDAKSMLEQVQKEIRATLEAI